MIDWFDIFMRVLTIIAIFAAGYNIGWSRGFDRCKKAVNGALDRTIQILKLQEKMNEAHNKSKGSNLSGMQGRNAF